jgi:hypothetical protein
VGEVDRVVRLSDWLIFAGLGAAWLVAIPDAHRMALERGRRPLVWAVLVALSPGLLLILGVLPPTYMLPPPGNSHA